MVNYQTGVATDPTDLINKLNTFLDAHGWTTDSPASGAVVISNGTIFAGIAVTTTEWQRRGCTGFSGGAAWNAQPGAAAFTDICNWGAGPFTAYHFFVGDEDGIDYVHVSVEVSANTFRHWVLGGLVKSGAFVGGTYCDSTFADFSNIFAMPEADYAGHRHICDATSDVQVSHIWADYDGKATPNWQRMRSAGNTADVDACTGSSRNKGILAFMTGTQDQGWNLRTPLFPATYFANRAANLVSPLGRIPNFRLVSVRNFTAGEIITYGSEQWQIFPVFVRHTSTPGTGVLSSALYGLAHRR